MADNGGLTWRCRPFNCSRCRVCLDLGIEGFVEVLEGSWCCVRLDLSVDGFIEVLGGSLCRVCLDLAVEGFVEVLGGSLGRICLDLEVEGFVEVCGIRGAAFASIKRNKATSVVWGLGYATDISSRTSQVFPDISVLPTPTDNPATMINSSLHPLLEGKGSLCCWH